MSVDPARSVQELTVGNGVSLEALVDRGALGELASSFYELFRVPLRVFSTRGDLMCEASKTAEVYEYLACSIAGRRALNEVTELVKAIDVSEQPERIQPCITGAEYLVSAIKYDGRHLGRIILGPYLPPAVERLPKELATVDPKLDIKRLGQLVVKIPRARRDTVAQLAKHLRCTLDLILFSAHRSLLTTNMHLATIQASYRDMERKNHELQEAYDRLKELDRLKTNFLATVSHELRTPLTSVIGYSEMLVAGIAGELNPEQSKFADTIHTKGEQLLELITSLLDMTKLESGTLKMRMAHVDVAGIVADVIGTLMPAAEKKGVELTASLERGLPQLWADPARLRQVLLNLSENAVKFTPKGGTVTVRANLAFVEPASVDGGGDAMVLFAGPQQSIQLSVADSGVGIADEEKSRVFDAFYQVDSSSTREAEGTGLGLSIVKRIVEAHEGRIHIEDNEPTGAQFVVTLPCKKATLY